MPESTDPTKLKTGWPSPVWKLFLLFLASTINLALCPWVWGWAALPGSLGLLLPFLVTRGTLGLDSIRSPRQAELLPPIPPWTWALLGAAVIWSRFFDLVSLSGWPLSDEAWVSYFASHEAFRPGIPLLFGGIKLPPLFVWGLAIVYRVFQPSLVSLWGFPAALSALTGLLSYGVARSVLSRSMAFLLFLGVSFSFWPMYSGRFSNPGVAVLLLELILFWFFSIFFKDPGGPLIPFRAFFLGMLTGAGFYIFASWASVALVASVTFFTLGPRPGRWRRGIFFGSGILLALVPIALDIHAHGYTQHLQGVSIWNRNIPLNLRLECSGAYLFGLFSPVPEGLCYWSNWGGMMNPLQGALFCLGLWGSFRGQEAVWTRWPALAGGLFLLPGVMSGTVEMDRTLPVVPVLAFYFAVGFKTLLENVPYRKGTVFALLSLLMAVSFGTDLYHLVGPYHSKWGVQQIDQKRFKLLESWEAYEKLVEVDRSAGPGILLGGIAPQGSDPSLDLMFTRMDCLRNPSLAGTEARWFAVIGNVHLGVALKKEFPDSRWFYLSRRWNRGDGGWSLGVFPLEGGNRELLGRLLPAEEGMLRAQGEFFRRSNGIADSMADGTEAVRKRFMKDPVVRGFLDRRLAFEYLRLGDNVRALGVLRDGMESGVPGADLPYLAGYCVFKMGNEALAERYYGLAKAFEPHFTATR